MVTEMIVLPKCPRCGAQLEFEDPYDVRRLELGEKVYIKCIGFECPFMGIAEEPEKEEEGYGQKDGY